jgi:hypothetical protein
VRCGRNDFRARHDEIDESRHGLAQSSSEFFERRRIGEHDRHRGPA